MRQVTPKPSMVILDPPPIGLRARNRCQRSRFGRCGTPLGLVTDVAMELAAFMTRLHRFAVALSVSARFRSSTLAFCTRQMVAELTVSQL